MMRVTSWIATPPSASASTRTRLIRLFWSTGPEYSISVHAAGWPANSPPSLASQSRARLTTSRPANALSRAAVFAARSSCCGP